MHFVFLAVVLFFLASPKDLCGIGMSMIRRWRLVHWMLKIGDGCGQINKDQILDSIARRRIE